MFDSKDSANEFLKFLNGRHNSIKFTTELEQAQEIPFLDILDKRCPSNTFLHLFTGRRHLLDFIPNGIHFHHASTKSTLSAR